MKGQYETRITKLEKSSRFVADKRTQEEKDADAWAMHEQARQELIAGTYQPPVFTDEGDISAYSLAGCWNGFLADIPEYAPFLKEWNKRAAEKNP